MSKYNNIKSIPIESLTNEELKEAIKEWAEGDESMERLLWACFNNEIKTSGCHAGSRPYLGIEYENNNKDKIIQVIDTVMDEKEAQVLFEPDGGNPYSGPSWYKPDITIGSRTKYQDVADPFFDKVSNTLNSNETNNNYSSLLNLFEFLINKYSGITLRLNHTENDEYVFSIEKSKNEKNINTFNSINELFSNAGLLLIERDTPYNYWTLKSNKKEEFISKLEQISNNIINNYSLEPPKSIEDTEDFKIKAHIKREEYIKDGKEDMFEIWLMEERRKLEEKMKKAYNEKQKESNNKK